MRRRGQSSSVERSIAAPHVQVIQTRSPSTALSKVAAATMLLEEGVEIGE